MTTSLFEVTLYRDDSTAKVVYRNVKHWFWTADNSTLVLAVVTDLVTGKHRYVHWLRESLCWFKAEEQTDAEPDDGESYNVRSIDVRITHERSIQCLVWLSEHLGEDHAEVLDRALLLYRDSVQRESVP